jgi:Flp pilus assembly protein TadG
MPERKGTAVVEFAVIAPILVFLSLGMIELSRGLTVRQVLSDAARTACRKAILPGASDAPVKQSAKDILDDYGISSVNATITVKVNTSTADCSTASRYDKITVQVSVPASKVSWIGSFFLSKQANIAETVVMMKQG